MPARFPNVRESINFILTLEREGGCSNVRLSNVRAPVVLTLENRQSLVQILMLIFIKLYGGGFGYGMLDSMSQLST